MIRTEVETCREICSDLCKIKDLKENVQQDNKLDLQSAGSSPYLTYSKLCAHEAIMIPYKVWESYRKFLHP